MHPFVHAAKNPEKTAILMAKSGVRLTYGELDARSNKMAHFFRGRGLRDGDCVAVLMENNARYFEVVWGAQRSGLYYACLSTRLLAGEARYIIEDSGARILIASRALAPLAAEIMTELDDVELFVTGDTGGAWPNLDEAVANLPSNPIPDEANGIDMLYSSGTTGRPKGVKPARPSGQLDQPNGLTNIGQSQYGMTDDTVYLSPAPLYHAAPLRWCMTVHRLGGTVIVMERFESIETLAQIAKHQVTHAQFVPTHFVRMLKLSEAARQAFDCSSLRAVFHAAAPCPVPVKQRMIKWWGPIIHEYYAGTEMNGLCALNAEEWLAHPGSVGRSQWGEVKICGEEDGEPLGPGETGLIYFAGGPAFEYHNDPRKTEAATNKYGWTTLGDIGRLDDEGYLYLTDRRSFTIISGGVNIYPQEIENILIMHDEVADVAVFGVPDAEMGEIVVAVVQPETSAVADEELSRRIACFAKKHMSKVKVPRRIHFITEMPRLPTGKLMKRILRDNYNPEAGLVIAG
ncbi:MAG: acyl-CoA synthetase [Sphingopyxis granuli]